MAFHIEADNPKGIAFDYLIEEPEQAAQILRNIDLMGGVNITVNGRPFTRP